jgi:hypothetical protein
MKDLLTFLDSVPLHYRQGRWSKFAHFAILAIGCWLGLYYREAQRSFKDDVMAAEALTEAPAAALQYFRIGTGLYFLLFMSVCLYRIGPWPLISYTVTSWNVLTMRLISSYFAASDPGGNAAMISRTLKFPALVMNVITVTIWWSVLVPVIHHLLGAKGKEHQEGFWKFNFSTFLLHIHGLNLPVALGEFVASGAVLHFYDFYCGVCIAFVYILWYLNVLDPAGLQIYIVFTPRTRWSVVTYAAVLAVHFAVYYFANALLVALR